MKYRIIFLGFIFLLCVLNSEEIKLPGWKELKVQNQPGAPLSKMYVNTDTIGVFTVDMSVTIADDGKNRTIYQSFEMHRGEEFGKKYINIGRSVSVSGDKSGCWYFLNGFNDFCQIFGGVADGVNTYFAKEGQRFISIIPKDIGKGKEFWLIMFIADENCVYQLYKATDCEKYNTKGM